MSDDSIADVPNEGEVVTDSVFEQAEDNVEKTTPESQPENKQTEGSPSQKGDNTPAEDQVPFHKHPRWKRINESNKQLQAELAELKKFREEAEPLLKQRQTQDLPDWWKKSYGDTPESKDAYHRYEETTKSERDRIKTEILEELQAQQTQSLQADNQAQEYIESEIETMQDEGLKFQTNELMKFIIDFQDQYGAGSLLDEQGNYDLRKALRLMQNYQPKQTDTSIETKKKLASETVQSKGSSQSSSDVPKVSRNALRRGSWRDAE